MQIKPPQLTIEPCPRCKSTDRIKSKLLLLAKYSPAEILKRDDNDWCGYKRQENLAIDECDPQVLLSAPLEQFVAGLYCDRCGIGYIPDSMLRSKQSKAIAKAD
jgi:hypothetical protein